MISILNFFETSKWAFDDFFEVEKKFLKNNGSYYLTIADYCFYNCYASESQETEQDQA